MSGFVRYLAVLKASYDYAPQSDDEVAIKEDQLLFLLQRTDEDWWKVKVKLDTQNDEGPVGLVPAAYVEEAPYTSLVKALYEYDASADGELSVKEDDVLKLYETEGDWILAQYNSADGAGYVPGNYVEEASGPAPTPAPVLAAPAIVVPESPPRPSLSNYEDPAVRVQSHKLSADDIRTWSVSELDKKGKKKKGTLGIGNGSLFFASESDKAAVQKWQTGDVTDASIDKPKHVLIEIGGPTPTSLHFHAGSKDNAEEILAKVHSSKAIATGSASRSEPARPSLTNKPSVHFSEESPVIIPPEEHVDEEEEEEEFDGEFAVALYDFKADGDDELSVSEGQQLLVLERDGDEWWKCRNEHGVEGVVPAQYIELQAGESTSATPRQVEDSGEEDMEGQRQAEIAAAAAAERKRQTEAEAAKHEEARKKREVEEREKRKRREEERAKAEQRERERKEAAPKAPPRPETNGTSSPSSPKPSEELKRPPPDKTRTWHDRSGQFKVDAAFLGFSNGKLRLHKVNGVTVEVPAEKMSAEDMKYVERVMAKGRRGALSDEDVPLAITARVNASTSGSNARGPPPPKKAPKIDWFDFFLSAGCDIDDCTRYASAFERDKIDETILADVSDGTMRSLGLKEGDIIRVKKAIEKRKPTDNLNKPSPYIQEQIRRDEELAKQLQAAESSGRPAPNLFTTGPGGVLKPRRGRPTPKGSLPLSTVDIKAIDSASDNIQRTSSPQSGTPVSAQPTSSEAVRPPPRSSSALAAPASGFDDNFGTDPWANRPSSTKPVASTPPAQAPRAPSAPPAPVPEAVPPPAPAPPAAPAPPPAAPAASTPSLAKTTESDIFDQLARLSKLREGASPAPPQALQPAFTPQPMPMSASPSIQTPSFQMGMGINNSPLPMGALQAHTPTPPQPYHGPRGPFAPVPANQGLLQPLIPTQTGFNSFVPTRAPTQPALPPVPQMQSLSLSPPPMMMSQQTGMPTMMTQATGMPMMAQPTGMPMNGGYGGGLGMSPFGSGSAFTGQTMQPLQPQFTSFNPNIGSQFNALAAPPVPPLPQQQAPKDNSPANIFASMKSGTFEDDSAQNNTGPRAADMYDAFRPAPLQAQPTGWGGQTYMGYQR